MTEAVGCALVGLALVGLDVDGLREIGWLVWGFGVGRGAAVWPRRGGGVR